MSISGQERMRISIHTSAREVTYSLKLIMRLLDISIHTSAREVTTEKREACKYLKNFNPHFRKGSDDEEAYSIDDELNFNPHFRKGSDGDELKTRKMVISISIHTSAREVTPSTTLHDVLIRFQSTLPQGK